MFDSLVVHIKDIFLAHVPDEDVNPDNLAEIVVLSIMCLEEKGIEVSPESISANADMIKDYIESHKDTVNETGKESLTLGNQKPAETSQEKIEKLEKKVKTLTAAAWVFLAVVFLYLFTHFSSNKA